MHEKFGRVIFGLAIFLGVLGSAGAAYADTIAFRGVFRGTFLIERKADQGMAGGVYELRPHPRPLEPRTTLDDRFLSRLREYEREREAADLGDDLEGDRFTGVIVEPDDAVHGIPDGQGSGDGQDDRQ